MASNDTDFSTTEYDDDTTGLPCRQNFHADCEAGINKQINMELYAMYTYMSMASHFQRTDIGFPGFYAFFKKSADEEKEHAEKLMRYQRDRGGRVRLQPIMKPTQDEWGSPLQALEAALQLEKNVNANLLLLHQTADQQTDPNLCDFIESEYLTEQVQAISDLSAMITRLQHAGPGLGEVIFDSELLEKNSPSTS